MKKFMRSLMVVVSLFLLMCIPANAEEKTDVILSGQLMTATETVDAKEEPDEKAAVVVSFNEGDPIYVVGTTEEGWYQISYQGKTGYIAPQKLQVQEMDVAALDKEMEETEAESKMIIDEVERYRQEARRSKIWGTVIVLLVIGIFATGIISTVKANKSAEQDEKQKENDSKNSKRVREQDRSKDKIENEVSDKKSESEIIDLDQEY